ncbi:alpha/beta fold hydrolase [Candidatus Protofrankia californiensis]|uniref:alpha/beta fold hydrolase n=1 Tax=Candidatus Protofrankia californiensis TaxID=1839754 RepID=UPI0013EE1811|nr:alpha/beta hydrolase [Candidatus Protofrankia californiensis]
MREHFVTGAAGARLRVLEHGPEQAPTVVLVHGLSLNAGVWDPLVARIQNSFRILAPDLRGHGHSDAPDDDTYSLSRTWAEDLEAVISLAGPGPVVLVAWSYGGLVATDFLRAYGQSGLSGLVLASPLRKIGSADALALLGPDFLATAGGLTSTDLDEGVAAVSAFVDLLRAGDWDQAARERLLGAALSVPPRVRAAILGRVSDGDDALAELTIPTRVVYGSDDTVIAPAAFAELDTIIAAATTTAYPGVGHIPFAEDPARFAAELVEFVGTLSPATAAVH